MDLKVEEIKALEPVKFNYDDLKKWITEKSSEYKKMVYTPETITLAKQDRATLNKVSEAINNEKKRIKNELLRPYVDFENKCKELMAIVDDASQTIDKQVKEFELKEQAEKEKQIKEIYDKYIGDYKDLILFDMIFNARWLNKTYTMKKIEEEIKHYVIKATDDMRVLEGQIKDEVILKQVQAFYFSHITDADCLSNSLKYGMNVIESNKKLETLKNSQNETKSEQNIAENSQNTTNNEQNVPKAENLLQIDFRVIATKEQFMKLKEFLETNQIDYRRI